MKDLVKNFLTESEENRIIESVKNAEKKTSGEIVPMIVSTSYDYPIADIAGASLFSLPLALIGAHFIGPLFAVGTQNVWVFLGFEIILFFLFYVIVKNVLFLKRMFISDNQILEEVREAAVINFYKHGLHRTCGETGIIIFISLFEKKVWVLGDRGINEKIGEGSWEEIASGIASGIKNKRQTDAICEAIDQVGSILQKHFPIKHDDKDELKNLILEK